MNRAMATGDAANTTPTTTPTTTATKPTVAPTAAPVKPPGGGRKPFDELVAEAYANNPALGISYEDVKEGKKKLPAGVSGLRRREDLYLNHPANQAVGTSPLALASINFDEPPPEFVAGMRVADLERQIAGGPPAEGNDGTGWILDYSAPPGYQIRALYNPPVEPDEPVAPETPTPTPTAPTTK